MSITGVVIISELHLLQDKRPRGVSLSLGKSTRSPSRNGSDSIVSIMRLYVTVAMNTQPLEETSLEQTNLIHILAVNLALIKINPGLLPTETGVIFQRNGKMMSRN